MNALRRNIVRFVVGDLLFTPPRSFCNGSGHRACLSIRIENRTAIDVSSSAAHCLNQRPITAQKALFIRIQNSNQRDLGHIEALSQQINTDQHIELTKT